MTLNFNKTLLEALEKINFTGRCHQFLVHEEESVRTHHSSDEIVEKYGETKWRVVDLLNEHYSCLLKDQFDLHNWLNYNQDDEVAYFLNEAGSNCLNYSEFKAPYKFHLWLGTKGFIVGIEQKGKGFNAKRVFEKKLKENKGAAFAFFKDCQSEIFFDNAEEAKAVFMEHLL